MECVGSLDSWMVCVALGLGSCLADKAGSSECLHAVLTLDSVFGRLTELGADFALWRIHAHFVGRPPIPEVDSRASGFTPLQQMGRKSEDCPAPNSSLAF
jgi:hypothetical protein